MISQLGAKHMCLAGQQPKSGTPTRFMSATAPIDLSLAIGCCWLNVQERGDAVGVKPVSGKD